jgi:hypothetical protein
MWPNPYFVKLETCIIFSVPKVPHAYVKKSHQGETLPNLVTLVQAHAET